MSINSQVDRINTQVSNQKQNLSTIASQLNSKLGLSVLPGDSGTPLEKNSATLVNIKNALNNYNPSSAQPIQLLESTDYSIDLQGWSAEISLVLRSGSMILIHYYDDQGGWNEVSPSCQGSSMNLINSYILSLETGSIYYYDSDNNYGYFDPPGAEFSGCCLLVVYE